MPHVQLVVEGNTVPGPLQTALQRVNARVSIRSLTKALASGVSPSADLCVILPGADDTPERLERILADASEQACATMVIPASEPAEALSAASSVGDVATLPRLDRRLRTHGVTDSISMSADELTGRIRALCELRRPLQRMRDELNRLRVRHAELTSGARERDEQLRLAGQIQMDLMSKPAIDAYPLSLSTLFLPADHVSGDIYDITRLDEDRFGFSLADATGHGLPAALLTILIKHLLRGKEIYNGCYRIIEPDELLGRLNTELLASHLSQCQFITGLHAIFDRTTSEIRWARGGAPYPILLRPGERPRQLRSAGGLIGAFESQSFEVSSHRLETGDTLLFYTDGLEALLLGRESSCGEGAILRSPWLDRLALDGADASLAEIQDRAASSTSAQWPRDDITIIAVQMN